MKKSMKNSIIILAIMVMIVSCKVGPNYQAPEDQTPQTFRYTKDEYMSKMNAKAVPSGFEYNSGTNESWLNVEEIRELIKTKLDSAFNAYS